MNKHTNFCNICSHMFFWCTALGAIFVLPAREIGLVLFSVGAESVYYSTGIFLVSGIKSIEGILALIWFCLFPLSLLLAYIFAVKHKYRYLWWMAVIDTCGAVLFVWFGLLNKNTFGIEMGLIDIIVSISFCFLFHRSIRGCS